MAYALRWPNADAADPAPSQHFPHFMPGHLRRSSRGTAHGDDPRDVAGGPALGCARNADFGWKAPAGGLSMVRLAAGSGVRHRLRVTTDRSRVIANLRLHRRSPKTRRIKRVPVTRRERESRWN